MPRIGTYHHNPLVSTENEKENRGWRKVLQCHCQHSSQTNICVQLHDIVDTITAAELRKLPRYIYISYGACCNYTNSPSHYFMLNTNLSKPCLQEFMRAVNLCAVFDFKISPLTCDLIVLYLPFRISCSDHFFIPVVPSPRETTAVDPNIQYRSCCWIAIHVTFCSIVRVCYPITLMASAVVNVVCVIVTRNWLFKALYIGRDSTRDLDRYRCTFTSISYIKLVLRTEILCCAEKWIESYQRHTHLHQEPHY